MPAFTSSTLSRYTGKWLIGMGLFELALAALFGFFALTDEELLFGFVLTAAILGVTGLGLVWFGLRARRSAAEADRITSTGIAGTATVTELTQTGMTLNNQPQVEIGLLVSLPGRKPYAASLKQFVPLILLGRLSSGQPLPVKVDPKDPQAIVIDWASGVLPGAMGSIPGDAAGTSSAGGPGSSAGQTETLAQAQAALAESGLSAAAPFATAAQGAYSVDQLRAIVRATGIDGTATIDKLADTGETIGDERLFTMEVTLRVPGQPDRRLQPSAAMVPITAADLVAVGVTVPVKVAPDNPDLIVFEWAKVEPGGPSTII